MCCCFLAILMMMMLTHRLVAGISVWACMFSLTGLGFDAMSATIQGQQVNSTVSQGENMKRMFLHDLLSTHVSFSVFVYWERRFIRSSIGGSPTIARTASNDVSQ
jgi:hypothetical protein